MSNYYDKFRSPPMNGQWDCVTMIVCMHPYHGVETFYLGLDEFQDNIKGLLSSYWVNGYTITFTPIN